MGSRRRGKETPGRNPSIERIVRLPSAAQGFVQANQGRGDRSAALGQLMWTRKDVSHDELLENERGHDKI